jgi:plastocyanin
MPVTKRVAVALVLVSLLGACSGGDDAEGDDAAAPGGETVTIQGIAYSPAELEVEAGTTITWTNEDDVLHTVTSGRQGEQGVPGVSDDTDPRPDGTFEGQLDGKDTTFEFTFDDPGTYAYYCDVHVGMVGEVVVN